MSPLTKEKERQMIFEMNVLDYFIFTDDPTRQAIYKINVKAREVGSDKWLKTTEPTYFIPDEELEGYLEA